MDYANSTTPKMFVFVERFCADIYFLQVCYLFLCFLRLCPFSLKAHQIKVTGSLSRTCLNVAVSKNAGGDTATCNIGSLAARHSASGDTATCNVGSLAARHSYIRYKDCTNRCSFLKNTSGLIISQLFNNLDAK